MQVSDTLKKRVVAKLQEGIAKAEAKYGKQFPMPIVKYDLRGTTAGTANYTQWLIRLNAVLLNENVDDFIARTVPHELAHLITDRVFPQAHNRLNYTAAMQLMGYRRPKRSVHGREWQSVMRVLGANPSRCHSYDVSNARVKRSSSYTYECPRCRKEFSMGPKRHKKAQAGVKFWHPGCGSSAFPLRLKAGAPVATKPVVKTKAKVDAPSSGSKLAKCYEYFKQYPGRSRDWMVPVFVNEVGMTKAGASTYYYQCKKLYEQGV